MNNINKNKLYQLCSEEFKYWLINYNDSDSVNRKNSIKKIIVVGSYLTDDFEEGESDIDIIILTTRKPTNNTKECWWQVFNESELQEDMKDCISKKVNYIDLNNVEEYNGSVEEHINDNKEYTII